MWVVVLAGAFLVASLGLWNGCAGRPPSTEVEVVSPAPEAGRNVHVESGALIRVALKSKISARTSRPGDAWQGTIAEDAVLLRVVPGGPGPGASPRGGTLANPIVVLDKVEVPAGSHVTGVIAADPVRGSEPGAIPRLAVTAIDVMGRTLSINAFAGQIETGSPRARGPSSPSAAADSIVLRFRINEIVNLR